MTGREQRMERAVTNYRVRLNSSATGWQVPPLLREFSRWLVGQPYGSVGRFELDTSMVPNRASLRRAGCCFARLPDDSLLVLDGVGAPARVLVVRRGQRSLVAPSLECFLMALAAGTTHVAALDGGAGSRRDELATWLRLNQVPRKARKTLAASTIATGNSAGVFLNHCQ